MTGRTKKILNVRTVIFIIASLFIALYTIIMISGYSGIEEEGRNTKNKGDKGYFILYNLLKRLGYKIQYWDTFSGFRRDSVLFYINYKQSDSENFSEIKKWVADGNILFFVGMKTETDPVFNNSIIDGDLMEVKIQEPSLQGDNDITYKSTIYFDKQSTGQTLLGNSQGAVLLKNTYEEGTVYLLSDMLFLSNKTLADENIAIFLNNLVKKYYGRLFFVYEQGFSGRSNTIGPLFQGKLFYFTIHIILMGIIFLLSQSIRFGNPIKFNPLARRTLQEHLVAVGYFYLKSNALNLADTYGLKYFLYQVKTILGIKKKIANEKLVSLVYKNYAGDEEEEDIGSLFGKTKVMSEKNILRKIRKRKDIITQLRAKRKHKK